MKTLHSSNILSMYRKQNFFLECPRLHKLRSILVRILFLVPPQYMYVVEVGSVHSRGRSRKYVTSPAQSSCKEKRRRRRTKNFLAKIHFAPSSSLPPPLPPANFTSPYVGKGERKTGELSFRCFACVPMCCILAILGPIPSRSSILWAGIGCVGGSFAPELKGRPK